MAVAAYDSAIVLDPDNLELYVNKGFIQFDAGTFEPALRTFQQVQAINKSMLLPYYMIPTAFYSLRQYDSARTTYYHAKDFIPTDNSLYKEILSGIGRVEYVGMKNYAASVAAYFEAIELYPDAYDLYPRLVKSLNAKGDGAKADSLFRILQKAYEQNELDEETMDRQQVTVAEYEWNDRAILVCRSLESPKNMIDVAYRIYVFKPFGGKLDRVFTVELTIQIEDGPKYLLCEHTDSGHATYMVGWVVDDIPTDQLRDAVIRIMEESEIPAASSTLKFEGVEE